MRRRGRQQSCPDVDTAPRPMLTSGWVCDYACGFKGTLEEVQAHEKTCKGDTMTGPICPRQLWCQVVLVALLLVLADIPACRVHYHLRLNTVRTCKRRALARFAAREHMPAVDARGDFTKYQAGVLGVGHGAMRPSVCRTWVADGPGNESELCAWMEPARSCGADPFEVHRKKGGDWGNNKEHVAPSEWIHRADLAWLHEDEWAAIHEWRRCAKRVGRGFFHANASRVAVPEGVPWPYESPAQARAREKAEAEARAAHWSTPKKVRANNGGGDAENAANVLLPFKLLCEDTSRCVSLRDEAVHKARSWHIVGGFAGRATETSRSCDKACAKARNRLNRTCDRNLRSVDRTNRGADRFATALLLGLTFALAFLAAPALAFSALLACRARTILHHRGHPRGCGVGLRLVRNIARMLLLDASVLPGPAFSSSSSSSSYSTRHPLRAAAMLCCGTMLSAAAGYGAAAVLPADTLLRFCSLPRGSGSGSGSGISGGGVALDSSHGAQVLLHATSVVSPGVVAVVLSAGAAILLRFLVLSTDERGKKERAREGKHGAATPLHARVTKHVWVGPLNVAALRLDAIFPPVVVSGSGEAAASSAFWEPRAAAAKKYLVRRQEQQQRKEVDKM